MKVMVLIPSILKRDVAKSVEHDKHPRMDYYALADTLRGAGIGQPENDVVLLDYAALETTDSRLVQTVRRAAGRDAALALLGFLRGKDSDVFFTNGENVGIPLALLLRLQGKHRPGHVTIGHRLSTGKKRLFLGTRGLCLHREMDTIFVYATTQEAYGRETLGIPAGKLRRIAFHADDRFYRPSSAIPDAAEPIVSAAGLEWRDYPTLLAAAARLPQVQFKLAAASPWSKHTNETQGRTLPPNVSVRRYEYGELRELYARSAVVAVPLYENDFQAGVTTLLEAMSMGKAVIVTQTTGQTDVITHGANGVVVPPNDPVAWEREIVRLVGNPGECARLGANARQWVQENASLDRWTHHITGAIRDACRTEQ
jgi:glycosyltransferase involved in cell wall biosynthesis